MRNAVLAVTCALLIGMSFSAGAALVDVGSDTGKNFIGANSSEDALYEVLNDLIGAGTFGSNQDLDGELLPTDGGVVGFGIVDVDDMVGGPFFNLERDFTFRVRQAAYGHQLSAVGGSSQVLFGFGTTPGPSSARVNASITSPFVLQLEVDPSGSDPNNFLYSDYTQNPPASQARKDVQMLLFDVMGLGLSFDYIFAWEDKLDDDWDYNDFVGTISIVPLPSSLMLASLGIAGLAARHIRRRRAQK
jgi:hypothetical protein